MDEIFQTCTTVIIYALGNTGAKVWEGIHIKIALRKARLNAKKQQLTITPEWYKMNRKASFYIVAPILGWATIYVLIFWLLSKFNPPIGIYILALLPLVPVIIGSMGLIFVPIVDEEDASYFLPFTKEDRKSARTKDLVRELTNKIVFSSASGDQSAINDERAFLVWVDDCIKYNPHIKPSDIPKIRGTILTEMIEKVFTHVTNLLPEKDQKELDVFLDKIPSNQEMWQFFARKIPDLNTQIGTVLNQFRDNYIAQSRKKTIKA